MSRCTRHFVALPPVCDYLYAATGECPRESRGRRVLYSLACQCLYRSPLKPRAYCVASTNPNTNPIGRRLSKCSALRTRSGTGADLSLFRGHTYILLLLHPRLAHFTVSRATHPPLAPSPRVSLRSLPRAARRGSRRLYHTTC